MAQAASCILVSLFLLIVFNYCVLYILSMSYEPATELNWIELNWYERSVNYDVQQSVNQSTNKFINLL